MPIVSQIAASASGTSPSDNAISKDGEGDKPEVVQNPIISGAGPQKVQRNDKTTFPSPLGDSRETSKDPALRSLGPWGKSKSFFNQLRAAKESFPGQPQGGGLRRKNSLPRNERGSGSSTPVSSNKFEPHETTAQLGEYHIPTQRELRRPSPRSFDPKKLAKQRDLGIRHRSSSSDSSGSEGSDRDRSNHYVAASNGSNEIRLRVDSSAPFGLQFDGDMEGRTLQLIPAENGMADIVIGHARDGRNNTGSGGQAKESRKSTRPSQTRRDEIPNAKSRNKPASLDIREGNRANTQSNGAEQANYVAPTYEGYDSDDRSMVSSSDKYKSSTTANVFAKRSRPSEAAQTKRSVLRRTPIPPTTRENPNFDIRSDSGYSSNAVTTSSSTHSALGAGADTSHITMVQSSSPVPEKTRRQSTTQPRPSITQLPRHRQGDCVDPLCTECRPNSYIRRQQIVVPSRTPRNASMVNDRRIVRPDPVAYYPSTHNPVNRREPTYRQGPVEVQPSLRRQSSYPTSRPRPTTYSDEPGELNCTPGMPPSSPGPSQDRGPPPSPSAYFTPAQLRQMPPPPPPRSPRYEQPYYFLHYQQRRPDTMTRTLSNDGMRYPPVPVATRERPNIFGHLQTGNKIFECSDTESEEERYEYSRQRRSAIPPPRPLSAHGYPEQRSNVAQRLPTGPTYQNPKARVYINSSKASRRQSNSVYDKMYEQYAQVKAMEEAYARDQAQKAQDVATETHGDKADEEQHNFETEQKERIVTGSGHSNQHQNSDELHSQKQKQTKMALRTSMDESSKNGDQISTKGRRREARKPMSSIPPSAKTVVLHHSPVSQHPADESADMFTRNSKDSGISLQEKKNGGLGDRRPPSLVLQCTAQGCPATFKGASRQSLLVRHMEHEHQRPSSPTSGHESSSSTSLHTKHDPPSILDNESTLSPESLIGQPVMPPRADRPRGPKLGFTPEQDQLLMDLREVKVLTWEQMKDFFPGSSNKALQNRYHELLNELFSGAINANVGTSVTLECWKLKYLAGKLPGTYR